MQQIERFKSFPATNRVQFEPLAQIPNSAELHSSDMKFQKTTSYE
jgi:hypothetical protein